MSKNIIESIPKSQWIKDNDNFIKLLTIKDNTIVLQVIKIYTLYKQATLTKLYIDNEMFNKIIKKNANINDKVTLLTLIEHLCSEHGLTLDKTRFHSSYTLNSFLSLYKVNYRYKDAYFD